MSIGSLNPLSSSYVQSALTSAVRGIDASSPVSPQADNTRLSPFAQLMSTLQQLQQSDPTRYKQVTGQIATNLQSAAQTARSEGNTAAATQLNQLAGDFTNASQSGELPNIQDLAKAVAGHHHHHHAHAVANTDSNASAGGTSSNSVSPTPMSQLLAAFQTSGSPSGAMDPMSIISSTLANAGITQS